jgi:hypothetical protein
VKYADIHHDSLACILQKNLPNKRHIGKQDPYCSISFHNEKRKTRAIKRGGQHPEWDEEVRFSLLEDTDGGRERTENGGDTPPPPPPKNGNGPRKIRGGTSMKLQCFADDPREPDLIGETMVDLTEVLTKGETDGVCRLSISTYVFLPPYAPADRVVYTDEQGQVLRRGVSGIDILV